MRFVPRFFSSPSAWYFSLIPINMAVGSVRVVITLAALALGATIFEIGLLIALNSLVSIAVSIGWGRVSDYFGLRIRFLIVFFLASAPLFVLLGLATAVWQMILLFTILALATAGIQPIAAMYAVEYRGGKDWQKEIVKYNSYLNTGVIAGLVFSSLITLVIPLNWLLYLESVFCVLSALVLWRTAKEPDLPLERHAYSTANLEEKEEEATAVFDYIKIRNFKLRHFLRRLKPIHLLFIACLIHWTGVYTYVVGEIPLMNAIGLSASVIFSINVAENLATVVSYSTIVPRVKMDYQKLVTLMIGSRSALILGWVGLTIFITTRVSYAFIFPLILTVLLLLFYALLWYPIMCFAISQTQPNKKGQTQGELVAVVSLANVLGGIIGGVVIGTFGFAVGFAVAALIAASALLILRYLNIEIKTD
ncbi:MFS transporter [Candidatus Bathyarchaeota archaeon]|mgnify:CR=1 FL=1|nr:MFS transporter [Candidatus Bathyarchaeota archaeon]